MGLSGDALHDAATARQRQDRLSRPSARDAIRFFLERRHLRVGVEEMLVVIREAPFANRG
jgi:hypothetical protein